MVYLTCNNFIKEVTYTNLLSESNIIDGLIFSPSKETLISKRDNHLKIHIKKGLPIVFLNKDDSHNSSSNIFNKKSDSNISNKNGYEAGGNSVKELLAKIESINLFKVI
jgi:LacI family transcriptional regulator